MIMRFLVVLLIGLLGFVRALFLRRFFVLGRMLLLRKVKVMVMWYFTVTSNTFTVFEFTTVYMDVYGPYPADTFKEALDDVLDVVRRAFYGLDVYVRIAHSSFDLHGILHGVVEVRLPFKELFDDGE